MHINNCTADNVAGNSVRLHFNADEFAAERFLSSFQADVEAVTYCVKNALAKQRGIDCKESTFCFGDYSLDARNLWAWTIIDLKMAEAGEASLIVGARERDGIRLYHFEGDQGILEDVELEESAAMVFEFFMRELLS
jgi:hypothetical protein